MDRRKLRARLLKGLPVEEELDMMIEEEVLYRDPGSDLGHLLRVYDAMLSVLRRERDDEDSKRLRSRRTEVS